MPHSKDYHFGNFQKRHKEIFSVIKNDAPVLDETLRIASIGKTDNQGNPKGQWKFYFANMQESYCGIYDSTVGQIGPFLQFSENGRCISDGSYYRDGTLSWKAEYCDATGNSLGVQRFIQDKVVDNNEWLQYRKHLDGLELS